MDPRRILTDLLAGPPPALPRALDRISEGWAAARPRTRLVVGALLALVTLAVAGHGAVRTPWGPPATVLLAATDLPAGRVLDADVLVASRWPSDLVPADALGSPDAAAGQVLATGVVAGLPLTARHLAHPGAAGDLPAGTVAFPLPRVDGPPVGAGQRLDLLGVQPDGSGVRLAAGATVLGIEGEIVWVAVRREDAAALAAAAAASHLTAVVLPP